MLNRSLFPKGETWATGDEALDLKLTKILDRTILDLNLNSIIQFYFAAKEIKPRAYNPMYLVSIEQMLEGLVAFLKLNEEVDITLKKIKGDYYSRGSKEFIFSKTDIVIDGLKLLKKFRYEDQIDFFLIENQESKRNPYFPELIQLSKFELQTKIIFKDLRLNIESKNLDKLELDFCKELSTEQILKVKGLGEFWFYQGQIYTISYM